MTPEMRQLIDAEVASLQASAPARRDIESRAAERQFGPLCLRAAVRPTFKLEEFLTKLSTRYVVAGESLAVAVAHLRSEMDEFSPKSQLLSQDTSLARRLHYLDSVPMCSLEALELQQPNAGKGRRWDAVQSKQCEFATAFLRSRTSLSDIAPSDGYSSSLEVIPGNQIAQQTSAQR